MTWNLYLSCGLSTSFILSHKIWTQAWTCNKTIFFPSPPTVLFIFFTRAGSWTDRFLSSSYLTISLFLEWILVWLIDWLNINKLKQGCPASQRRRHPSFNFLLEFKSQSYHSKTNLKHNKFSDRWIILLTVYQLLPLFSEQSWIQLI